MGAMVLLVIFSFISYNDLIKHIFFIAPGLFLLGLGLFVTASLLKTVPDLTDTKFWIKRIILDSTLGLIVFPLLLMPLFFWWFNLPGDEILSDKMSPLGFFVLITASQLGLGTMVLLRATFRAIPTGALQISFRDIKQIFKAVLIYGLPVFAINFLYIWVLKYFNITPPPQFVFTSEVKNQFWFVLIGGAILAPIFEELFFRGYLLPITTAKKTWVGLVVTSTIFASIHLSLTYAVPLFVFGIIAGLSYLRTRNLLVPIFIHMINNLVAFGTIIMTS